MRILHKLPIFVLTCLVFLLLLSDTSTIVAQNSAGGNESGISLEEDRQISDRAAEVQEQRSSAVTQAAERRAEVEARVTDAAEQIEEKKSQALDTIKNRLLTHIDRAISHFNTIKERINNSTGLSDEEKSAAITEIDTHINSVNEFKNQVSSAENISDLRGIGEQVTNLWQDYKSDHLKYVGLHLAGKFQAFLDRVTQSATNLESRLNTLETERDLDLSAVRESLANFNSAVVSAQMLINEAKDIFNSIVPGSSSRTTFNSGMDKLREAKQLLHTAHAEVKEAIQQAKDALNDA